MFEKFDARRDAATAHPQGPARRGTLPTPEERSKFGGDTEPSVDTGLLREALLAVGKSA
jgi:hypothetical protein